MEIELVKEFITIAITGLSTGIILGVLICLFVLFMLHIIFGNLQFLMKRVVKKESKLDKSID